MYRKETQSSCRNSQKIVASHIPQIYWVETLLTALYLINRLPIFGLVQSPWELLFHTSSAYTRLKVFGCSCYPCIKPYVTSKLDGKSKQCVFLGYSLQHKDIGAWILQLPKSISLGMSYLMRLHFHFIKCLKMPSPQLILVLLLLFLLLLTCNFQFQAHHLSYQAIASTILPQFHMLLVSLCNHKTPVILQSHSSSSVLQVHNIHHMVTKSKIGIFTPQAYTATKHPLPSSLDYVPTTFNQASKYAEWRSAMQDEFNALQSHRNLDFGSF